MIKFDKFEVIKKLGEGGMARVFLIKGQNNANYALKELKNELLSDDVIVKRFYHESHSIKSFECENIIKIIAPTRWVKVFKDDRTIGKAYVYVMEYIEHLSLKDILLQKQLSIKDSLSAFAGLVTALEYGHSKGVVHRDVKPANLLIKDGSDLSQIVLTDFGIAKIHKSLKNEAGELTVELSILGAPAYMSPEQISNSKKVTNKSDLYSAGIVLYEMLTSKKPFTGDKWDVIAQHKDPNLKPTPPQKLNPLVDKRINDLTLKLLEKNPKDRPRDAHEVLNLLSDFSTTTISYSKKDFTQVIYKSNPGVKIDYSHNGKLYTQSYSNFPIKIGRYAQSAPNELKFNLPPELKGVSRIHCEVFLKDNNQVFIKDS
ncbi:MAG: serine/threonine protein kinase, partial [Ignavibacteriaceae bacterium]|nr:serine/threonine protein kinase [Ignavibacteriaceae bacterium]